MNEHLIDELLALLKPALRSPRKASRLLEQYWADRGAIVWTSKNIHRAANEIETVLTDTIARDLLATLIIHHNPQYGLCWGDVTEVIQQSGLGRDIKRRELHRFIHHDRLTIDPPIKPTRKKGSS